VAHRRAEWALLSIVVLVVLAPDRAEAEREHFQVKLGPSYDQGDFGTSQMTRTFFFPVTLRYLGERFDVGVTGSFVRLEAPRDVAVVEGAPTQTGEDRGGTRTTSGLGDTILNGRWFALDDPGPGSWRPGLAASLKLKLPTADEDEGLGTGELDGGFGVEFDKTLGRFIVFGDASFTFMGDPPHQNFRDRPAASLGVGYRVSATLTVIALVDWRGALVAGRSDPVELVGLVSFKLTPLVSLSPNAFVGLTDASPDFGIGLELSYRFGRW
jgi:hypothetical protein